MLDTKIKNVLDKISEAGFEVAVVGGAVRDILANEEPKDWDVTTNAKPEEVMRLFPNAFYNNKFGTVAIGERGKAYVEITTYRKDIGYSDSRHPDKVVWGAKLEDDLARRDFTINAIALVYKDGKIDETPVDPFGGVADFEKKIIRAVGEPDKRFKEDALRLLRAVRFAVILDFKIEAKTLFAMKKNAKLLSRVSGERIRDELFKMIDAGRGAEGILLARETGLLAVFMPELEECFDVEQKSPKRHHIYNVGMHCVMSLKHCPSNDTIVRFATLLHDVGKVKVADVTEEGVRTFYNHEVVGSRIANNISDRLHLSRIQKDKVFKLVRWHQFSVSEDQTDKAIRRFIKNAGLENVEDMMDLRIGDRLGGGVQEAESWRLKLYRKRIKDVLKKPFSVSDLKVNGADVMRVLSIKPGPKVGDILDRLFGEVEEDSKKNKREYLLSRIKELS